MAGGSDLEFRVERARTMRRAMQNCGLTQTVLATKSGYDERTIRNVLKGESVRDQTIIDICNALGVDPVLENNLLDREVSDNSLGGYTRATHRNYDGYYKGFRYSFSTKGKIFRSVFKLAWSDTDNHFRFDEYYQPDDSAPLKCKAHSGSVYMSPYTGLIHFLTVDEGSVRVVTVTKMRDLEGIMRGVMLTQSETPVFFYPTVTPVVLIKQREFEPTNDIGSLVTVINEFDEDYAGAKNQLDIAATQITRNEFQ